MSRRLIWYNGVMQIIDSFTAGQSIVSAASQIVMGDGSAPKDGCAQIQMEHQLDVRVNDVLTMALTCSPDHLPELVLGRLYSEGLIRGVDDVERISVDESGLSAEVQLRNREADFSKRHVDKIPTCSSDAQTLNLYFAVAEKLTPVKPIAWDARWIFDLATLLVTDTPMHKVTFGVHSCFLSQAGKVLFCCEDLGRHNAFDKIIGCALRHGIDLTQCVVFSSGRLPVDMVSKAIRAGIPIVASKAVPTDAGVKLAREYDLTLICSAYPDKMVILNDPNSTVSG